LQRSSETTPEWQPLVAGEGNVIAFAELTPVAAPIADVHNNGLDLYNYIHTYSNTKTVESLSKHVLDQVCETTAGRTKAKNSANVIQEHRSGADDSQSIDEIMNSAGRKHKMRISVQDKLIVRNSFGVRDDDVAITYMCDVMRPPLPPPAVPPNAPTKRVEPFEPLSVIDQVGTEMLKVSLALNNKDIPEMRAFAHVSTELIHGVGPREPLSASDQVVAEMFVVPPAPQASHKTSSPPTNRVEPHEPLSASDHVVAEMLAVPPALQTSHNATSPPTNLRIRPSRYGNARSVPCARRSIHY
jgi:hypothetical protein